MTVFNLPYGKGHMEIRIPDERLVGVLESRAAAYQPAATEAEQVRAALENPIGSPRLRDLARGRDKVVIIASDHTRPVPTRIIAPQMLAEIRRGNPRADITFLVATGFHRASTRGELADKFGPEMLAAEKIVMHDCTDATALVHAGRLPSGGELVINRLAMEADLLVAEGFIEPHVFAGFSGGRKSVLPGIVSRVTVLANHCAEFVMHEKARSGSPDGNPMHIDMLHAARTARLAFIVNVVLDAERKIIRAVAGDAEQAHLAGCRFLGELAAVQAMPADIVVTTNGGYPLDQNLYQHGKSLCAAEATCREGGVIIVCGAMIDGIGSAEMYADLKAGARATMDRIMAVDRNATVPDQWATQIMARIMLKHTIIFVTRECDHRLIEDIGCRAADTFEGAMAMAEAIVGPRAGITVVPDGVAVIVGQQADTA